MIYSLYIFDRHCACVFHTTWNSKAARQTAASKSDSQSASAAAADASTNGGPGASAGGQAGGLVGAVDKQTEENAKLVYGVVFSLRNIINKISTRQGENFISYRTNSYKLHYFETGTCIKFVMLTDPGMENMVNILRSIYAQVYVEYVSKNALLSADGPINNELFRTHLMRYVRSLPGFSTD